jgi:hypothetical protein
MAICMAMAPLVLSPAELNVQGVIDTGLWAVWFSAFTVPVALLVGVPAFGLLRRRGWLNAGVICITGLTAGLGTIAVLYGISSQSINFGFLVLGGFGGLVAGAVSSLIVSRRSNHTLDREARESGAPGSP